MNTEQTPTELRALMLPLQDTYLLLPQTAVADISFHYEKVRDRSQKPDWFYGDLYWHGSNIPVVSYEKLNRSKYSTGLYKEKIAICNLLNSSENYSAVGILVKAVPRMLQIQSGTLLTSNAEEKEEYALSHVQFQGDNMAIPDLEKIGKEIDRTL